MRKERLWLIQVSIPWLIGVVNLSLLSIRLNWGLIQPREVSQQSGSDAVNQLQPLESKVNRSWYSFARSPGKIGIRLGTASEIAFALQF